MSRDVHLNVLLPRNRDHPGRIRVEVNGTPIGEFHVLGRGSTTVNGRPTGNSTRTPFWDSGDTPTGSYVSPRIESTASWNQSSYGPWGAIRLKAVAGDALVAQDIFGRKGLLIHGGAPGRFDGYKSTRGCLRVSNDDMRQLIQLISDAGDSAQAEMCESVSVRITIRE
jgi:lipoprotein-anchoring transpeptidase ErfK/SrfK